jgi:acetyltransferase-like isoleucine patch superfamily enzyme
MQDGVHMGHGVLVCQGSRIHRGAILGDLTVAAPDRQFPAHSVTQVR